MDACDQKLTMKKEDIHISDWLRIVVGEVPAGFYIELVLRAAIVFLLINGRDAFYGQADERPAQPQ
jgi:hypothetical protein